MNRIKNLFLSVLVIVPGMLHAQGLTVKECEQAADKGVFLAQVELGFLYFSGTSQVLETHPKDYVKAMHYLQMAATNSETQGKETLRLKTICMAYLAQLYAYGERYDKRLKYDIYDAFFWAYAALSFGLDAGISEDLYKNVVEAAVKGMYLFARIDKRFCSEFMHLKDVSTVRDYYSLLMFDRTYDHALKQGIRPAASLKLNARINEDWKYVGELSDEKINGIGILIWEEGFYCGNFANGKFFGKGYVKFKETGSVKVGEWRDGELYNGILYEDGEYREPSVIYRDGKGLWPRPISLNIGKTDKGGNVIPVPENMDLSVRWASGLMGSSEDNRKGELYRWGATNPKHTYQSRNPSLPNYLPHEACLAIYGGAGRRSDIIGTGYDAPYCLWSNAWRMPTREEMEELVEKCKITVEKDGKLIISREDDISGEPEYATTIIIELPRGDDGYGIWTGSIHPINNEKAYALVVDVQSGSVSIKPKDRECGFAILPVTDIPFYQSELY